MSVHQSIDTTMYEWWIQVGTVKIGQQRTVKIGQQNNKLLFLDQLKWVFHYNWDMLKEILPARWKNKSMTIVNTMIHLCCILQFEDYVYWTDWQSQEIVRANKYNGKQREVIRVLFVGLMDIEVVTPDRQTGQFWCAFTDNRRFIVSLIYKPSSSAFP